MVRQRDIAATLNAASKAGFAVKRVKFEADGSATIVFEGAAPTPDEIAEKDDAEWGRLIAKAKSRGTRR